MESVGVVLKGEKQMRYLTVLFLTAALAGIASADILSVSVDSNPVPETKDLLFDAMGYGDYIPAGTMIENDLHFVCDDDWLSAVLVVTPDVSGHIYQWDVDTPPHAINWFPWAPDGVYPTKVYDSWISDGLGGTPSTAVAVDFGYTEKVFETGEIAMAFYTDLEEIGDLILAQITLSVEATGTWQFRGTSSPASDPDNGIFGPVYEIMDGAPLEGIIVDGEMLIIPEPATLGLLLIGGVGVLIRRKR